eukprot:TRINITY_DN8543_c0_g1_i1.p3 TRINITY_DN8543_c0_g1~~TRINITY_DN8543_c0_g1_i1.p3  ORF type:complete len:145 (+),score=44.79 TRINITY_DN8543_c0_g1_i1:29-436(+)
MGAARPLWDPVVGSNLSLFLPAWIYYRCGHPAAALSLAASTGASLLYHASRETEYVLVDQWLAAVAFLVTVRLTTHLTTSGRLSLAVSVLLAFAALFISSAYRESEPGLYVVWHTLWHGLVCAGQLQVACSLLLQ